MTVEVECASETYSESDGECGCDGRWKELEQAQVLEGLVSQNDSTKTIDESYVNISSFTELSGYEYVDDTGNIAHADKLSQMQKLTGQVKDNKNGKEKSLEEEHTNTDRPNTSQTKGETSKQCSSEMNQRMLSPNYEIAYGAITAKASPVIAAPQSSNQDYGRTINEQTNDSQGESNPEDLCMGEWISQIIHKARESLAAEYAKQVTEVADKCKTTDNVDPTTNQVSKNLKQQPKIQLVEENEGEKVIKLLFEPWDDWLAQTTHGQSAPVDTITKVLENLPKMNSLETYIIDSENPKQELNPVAKLDNYDKIGINTKSATTESTRSATTDTTETTLNIKEVLWDYLAETILTRKIEKKPAIVKPILTDQCKMPYQETITKATYKSDLPRNTLEEEDKQVLGGTRKVTQSKQQKTIGTRRSTRSSSQPKDEVKTVEVYQPQSNLKIPDIMCEELEKPRRKIWNESTSQVWLCSLCPPEENQLYLNKYNSATMYEKSKTPQLIQHIVDNHPECKNVKLANGGNLWLDKPRATWWPTKSDMEQANKSGEPQLVEYSGEMKNEPHATKHYTLMGENRDSNLNCSCGETLGKKDPALGGSATRNAAVRFKRHVQAEHKDENTRTFIIIPPQISNFDEDYVYILAEGVKSFTPLQHAKQASKQWSQVSQFFF